jgi:hypothetical protein
MLGVKQELSKPTPKVINPEDGDCNVCQNIENLDIQCSVVLKAEATE